MGEQVGKNNVELKGQQQIGDKNGRYQEPDESRQANVAFDGTHGAKVINSSGFDCLSLRHTDKHRCDTEHPDFNV
jgi:hypothetical protein